MDVEGNRVNIRKEKRSTDLEPDLLERKQCITQVFKSGPLNHFNRRQAKKTRALIKRVSSLGGSVLLVGSLPSAGKYLKQCSTKFEPRSAHLAIIFFKLTV